VQDRPYISYSLDTLTVRVLFALIAGHIIHIEILAKCGRIFPYSLTDLCLTAERRLEVNLHLPLPHPFDILSIC
jgi:hypothetical protein